MQTVFDTAADDLVLEKMKFSYAVSKINFSNFVQELPACQGLY